jgi:cytochrome d ubiquinol oxidase subunit II
MVDIIIAFLYLSLLMYLLFGGADFGAGIIEFFTSDAKKDRTRLLTYQAIGPIWEANHMWLIITIVILFVGFPKVYSTVSIFLHIPVSLLLLGIIARGTAFIFRHYDPDQGKFQPLYNLIFVYSSFLSPLFLGILAGTIISGRIDLEAASFPEAYLFPWLGFFPISVGLFTVAICGYLAAVFLIGEAQTHEDQLLFRKKANRMNVLTVVAGAVVFLAATLEGIPLLAGMLEHPITILALALASISLPLTWKYLRENFHMRARILVGFQVSMILFSLFYSIHPAFMVFKNSVLILKDAAAGPATMNSLGIALLVGSVFILPSLFYLIYSFQKRPFQPLAKK